MKLPAGGGRPLRVVTKCSSIEEFVATFRRLVDEKSIFVVMKAPRPVGGPHRFSIQLSDGRPVLVGEGRVLESTPMASGSSRPGMRIELAGLDEESRGVHKMLIAARAASPPPMPPPPPRPAPRSTLPDAAPAGASAQAAADAGSGIDDPTNVSAPLPIMAVAAVEQRTPGATFTLPANPFGTLTDEALEHFIECTMYEESGVFEPVEQVAPALGGDAAPAVPLVSRAAELPAPAPPVLPGAIPAPAPVPADAVALPPPPPVGDARASSVAGLFTPLPGSMPQGLSPVALLPTTGPDGAPLPLPAPPPTGAMRIGTAPHDTEAPPDAFHARRRSRIVWIVAAAVVVSAAAGLAGGYFLRGRGSPAAPAPVATKQTSPPPAVAVERPVVKDEAAPPEAADPAPVAVDPAPAEPAPPRDEPVAGGTCLLRVVAQPTDAKVSVGGRTLGMAAAGAAEVPCGEQVVVFEHPRYERVERVVKLAAGATETIELTMVRPEAVLALSSTPPGASFSVDGRTVGVGAVSAKVLGYTFVTVSATLAGHKPWSQKMYVRGRTVKLAVKLEPLQKSKPPGKTKLPAPAPAPPPGKKPATR